MQSALDSSNIKNFRISEMMNSWIHLKYYPVLKVTQHDVAQVRISMENYDPSTQKMLRIPVTYLTYLSFRMILTYSHITWLQPSSDNEQYIYININYNDGWIIINIEEAGKYSYNKIYYNYFL